MLTTGSSANVTPRFRILFTLKIEATSSSETSVLSRPTRYHIIEDGILHNDRSGNLKSYISELFLRVQTR
jgi:hypothetical protein